MKIILLISMTCIGSMVMSQDISISKDLSNNGKTITIKVNGDIDGRKIDYANTFSSGNLSKSAQEALINHVLDSLGVGNVVLPLPPAPKPPVAPSLVLELKNDVPQITSESKYDQLLVIGGTHPYTKEIKYNPTSGVLFMKYRFTKKGEEHSYEKTVNAGAASAQERAGIIKSYEKEIGLPIAEK